MLSTETFLLNTGFGRTLNKGKGINPLSLSIIVSMMVLLGPSKLTWNRQQR